MDHETIIRLAKDADFKILLSEEGDLPAVWSAISTAELERFAAAVAAAVKEEDARICGTIADEQIGMAYESIADDCAAAIRASIREVK